MRQQHLLFKRVDLLPDGLYRPQPALTRALLRRRRRGGGHLFRLLSPLLCMLLPARRPPLLLLCILPRPAC